MANIWDELNEAFVSNFRFIITQSETVTHDHIPHHSPFHNSSVFVQTWVWDYMDVIQKTRAFLSNWSKSGEADWYVQTNQPGHRLGRPPFYSLPPNKLTLLYRLFTAENT
jgi:hypothetical protein